MSNIKPIFLLADSQLLFWREEGGSFLARVRALIEEDSAGKEIQAAYIGASNGDAPEFYELFVAAMNEAGIHRTRMIPSHLESEDREFLEQADLILLAGGDVRRGWKAFEDNGLNQKIMELYYAGALLIGVSAGAVQLGVRAEDDKGSFNTFRLVPFIVDAHDEPGWTHLHKLVSKAGEHARGYGIPSGGGVVYHPDYSMEPIRHPAVEVSLTEEGTTRQALVFPGEGGEQEPEEERTFSPEVREILADAGYVKGPGAGSSDDDGSVN
ncbi:MAG TPA: Type 1 glutamine amidotransferase-like domain-containing protein [Thermoanaerobaculia bacterium]